MGRRYVPVAVAVACALALSAYVLRGPESTAQENSGARIFLYLEPNFQGPGMEVTGSLVDIRPMEDVNGVEIEWNDQVRSIIVEKGTWRLHQNGRFGTKLDDTPLAELDVRTKESVEGWSCLISATSQGPLRIASPSAGGFAHDISSIELVSEENLPDWAMARP